MIIKLPLKKNELTTKVEAFNQIYCFFLWSCIKYSCASHYTSATVLIWFVLVSIKESQRLKIGNKNTLCFQEIPRLKAACIFQLDVSLVFYSFTRDIHVRIERPTKFRLTKFDEGGEFAR